MAFERTRDVLDYAKKFHRDLSGFYAKLGETAAKEKIRILLNYISRHEQHLEECLQGYENDASRNILDTWFKYTPEMPPCRCFEKEVLTPDMTVDQVVETMLRIDRCFIELYRQMAEKAHTPEMRDLFNKLLDMEKTEETQLLSRALSFIEQD